MVVSRVPDGQFQFRLGEPPSARAGATSRSCAPSSTKQVNTSDKGYTLAWDPVAQKERFRIDNPYDFQGGNAGHCRQPAGAGHDEQHTGHLPCRHRREAVGIPHVVGAGGRAHQLQRERHAVHRGECGLEQGHRARPERRHRSRSPPGRPSWWCSRSVPRAWSCRRRRRPQSLSPPPRQRAAGRQGRAGRGGVRAVLLDLPWPERHRFGREGPALHPARRRTPISTRSCWAASSRTRAWCRSMACSPRSRSMPCTRIVIKRGQEDWAAGRSAAGSAAAAALMAIPGIRDRI